MQWDAIEQEWLLPHGLDQLARLLASGIAFETFEQQPEFVAANPRDNVERANHGPQDRGDMDQGSIAGKVTMGIVDLLETVEIDKHHPCLGAVTAPLLDDALDFADEAPAIGKRCQRVGIDQTLEFGDAGLKRIDGHKEVTILVDFPIEQGTDFLPRIVTGEKAGRARHLMGAIMNLGLVQRIKTLSYAY